MNMQTSLGPVSNQVKKMENPMISEMKKQADQIRNQPMMSSLETKLEKGVKLDKEELEFLKKNNSYLYEKALKHESVPEVKLSRVSIEA